MLEAPVRLRWEFNKQTPIQTKDKSDKIAVLQCIDNGLLDVVIQPIYTIDQRKMFAVEALSRLKSNSYFSNISELFAAAKDSKTSTMLDIHCRDNILRNVSRWDLSLNNLLLFINVLPETILDNAYSFEVTKQMLKEYAIPKEKIVFEITEDGVIKNYNEFLKAVKGLKKSGYRIAIDDFGAGYCGLKMLSIIEPDFVKIDRHFIADIDKAIMKFNLVDSVATVCHRMGFKVIAEGVETMEELNSVRNLGIDYVQGFLLARPSPELNLNLPECLKTIKNTSSHIGNVYACANYKSEVTCISEIAIKVETISKKSLVKHVLELFIDNHNLRSLPVVDNDRLYGMIFRNRFIENQVVGKMGYGMHLNTFKNVVDVMEKNCLVVEANTSLEEVAKRVQLRSPETTYDDICVTKNGKYLGIVPISKLLEAITEKSILLARCSNPLTGLPGNEAIQREIEIKIAKNMHFDVGYIDLNNFKPFNDNYGFERGDYVIKKLADIVKNALNTLGEKDFDFAGHIGGDDFIFITRPQLSIAVAQNIVYQFEAMLLDFHGKEDYTKGFYTSKNRHDETETFSLLSLAIGLISTEVYSFNSYAEVASIATEIKKAAKKQHQLTGKSTIVRDRRLMGSKGYTD